MHLTRDYLTVTFLGLASITTLGCNDSNGPPAPSMGAIEITVSTVSAMIDRDTDGYTLSIDGGPDQFVGVNATLTIGALRRGKHLVRLGGLAPNCSVNGTNPRFVDVVTDEAMSTVSFSVSCQAKTDGAGGWDY